MIFITPYTKKGITNIDYPNISIYVDEWGKYLRKDGLAIKKTLEELTKIILQK